MVQPYLLGLLVSYLNGDPGAVPLETAYGIGACLGLSAILQICLNPTYFFIMQHVAMRMKVAVGALIYRKVRLIEESSTSFILLYSTSIHISVCDEFGERGELVIGCLSLTLRSMIQLCILEFSVVSVRRSI